MVEQVVACLRPGFALFSYCFDENTLRGNVGGVWTACCVIDVVLDSVAVVIADRVQAVVMVRN